GHGLGLTIAQGQAR
ncbi:hypothetical protein, partial [Nocardiopsis rhodophaea]